MTIEQLRALLKQLTVDAQAVLDAADKDGGAFTAEQEAKYDAIMAEFDANKKKLDRMVKLSDEKADLEASAGRQVKPSQDRIEVIGANNPDKKTTAGFSNIADFANTIVVAGKPGGYMDNRLQAMLDVQGAPSNYHTERGADGYMVPPQFREEIWALVYNGGNDLLNMVNPEPTNSNQVDLTADESTPYGATGVQAYWRSEGAQMTPSRLDTAGRSVKLHELYAFVTATDELLQDAPRLNSRLTKGASDAIRFKASDAIMNGTGAGQPLGFFKSSALVSVAKESSQTAVTINAANVTKMYSRLLPSNIGGAFWLANSDCIPQLMQLNIGNDVTRPAWVPPNGMSDATGGTLLGRPVYLSEHCQTLGTKGDLVLVDPNGYYAVQKSTGIKFDSSIHLYFDYGLQAFRWSFRLGGTPFLSAPVSPKNGSNNKSHFISLDTRA